MRFPWLQVDADFIAAHAGDLGAHLGIGRREAIGLAVDLWTWALARAPDDAPPDGIVTGTGAVPDRLLAGSVGWTGPEAQLTEALVSCGLAVRIESGYRLTGFSRYKATWEKNRRRPGGKPDRNRTGTGEKPERKTQTYTQKKDETTLAAGADEPEDLPDATEDAHPVSQPPLFAVPPPEKPKRKAGADPETLREVWNRVAPPLGFQVWEAMGDDRKRDARLALEAVPDLAKWEAWLTHELARPWNRGENSDGWKANVEWFLRKKTRNLVLDFNPATAPKLPTSATPPKPTKFIEM